MSSFTEAFTQGSHNFKTSPLSDHDQSKMHVQTANESTFIKSTKHGEQQCPAPVSLSVPKNVPILKRFN